MTACLFYLPARKNREALLGGMALLYLLFMAEQAGFFAALPFWPAALRVTDDFATHAAVVLAGVMLGTILQPDAGFTGLGRRVRWVLLFSLGLYLASVLLHALKPLHEMFIISKNLATPVWCLRSSAYTALLWLAVYLLVDVLHFRGGTRFLAAAGGNALFAYILAPIAYNLLGLAFMIFGVSDLYAASSAIFTLGLARAIVIAFFITWLAGFLRRRGLFLKL